MKDRKAPPQQETPDAASETWARLPWKKFEKHVYRIQKRIFRASQQGNTRAVHKLQKLLMKSEAARHIAVRRVTQENQGKKTAGVDGVKSIPPRKRFPMIQQLHPQHWSNAQVKPVRRVYIPKPGKDEKRPLGIPTLFERSRQALVKLALEPQWEAKFEPNSYGFRPGRSAHDAIGAIFNAIAHKEKYLLDADIAGCFDHIDHQALLSKLETYPTVKHTVKAWLKAGVLTDGAFTPTEMGAPQGGIISPLLMNIALHGMEKALQAAYTQRDGNILIVRYADDFVIFHSTEEGIHKAKEIIEKWLKAMGLELKPSKTRIGHTLNLYQGQVGFDFLGFSIRQYPVGKYRTGKNTHGKLLGFKTLIKPSKEARKRQIQKLGEIHQKNRNAPQEQLIKQLNPVIRGWSSYYRTVVSKETFKGCDHELFFMNLAWARRRHPNKNMHWVKNRYWHKDETRNWIFRDQEGPRLRQHSDMEIQRHVKVRGDASPYDGNLLYWSKRLKNNPMLYGKLAKLLQKQQGKCRWCELAFKDGDRIEIDHIDRDHDNNALSNQMAIHLHCHHNRHAKIRAGIFDKDAKAEEPDEGKLSRPVLKTSMEGDFPA